MPGGKSANERSPLDLKANYQSTVRTRTEVTSQKQAASVSARKQAAASAALRACKEADARKKAAALEQAAAPKRAAAEAAEKAKQERVKCERGVLPEELRDAVFSNEDLFESISSKLGAWAYLDLGCVAKGFAQCSWVHVLRLLQRLQPDTLCGLVCDRFASALLRRCKSMPAKVLHVRKVAFSLGLNANGRDLAGTLQLLSRTYPELAGLTLSHEGGLSKGKMECGQAKSGARTTPLSHLPPNFQGTVVVEQRPAPRTEPEAQREVWLSPRPAHALTPVTPSPPPDSPPTVPALSPSLSTQIEPSAAEQNPFNQAAGVENFPSFSQMFEHSPALNQWTSMATPSSALGEPPGLAPILDGRAMETELDHFMMEHYNFGQQAATAVMMEQLPGMMQRSTFWGAEAASPALVEMEAARD